jgi:hypothetical protein
MFMLLIVAAALVTMPLFGGRLGNIGRLKLRARWSVLAAVIIQLLVITVFPWGNHTVHALIHGASYAIAAIFLVLNRQLFGMWLAALGAALNALVIAVNNGVMPATEEALRLSGVPRLPGGFENSTTVTKPRLLFLGDIFAIPHRVPLANVFSVGDVVLLLGVLVILHWTCESKLVPQRVLASRRPPLAGDGEQPAVPSQSGS